MMSSMLLFGLVRQDDVCSLGGRSNRPRLPPIIPFIGANLPASPRARRADAEQRVTGTTDDLIDVCFTPESGHVQPCPLCAKSGLCI